MNQKIKLLPVAYKIGAVVDLYFVFALIFPSLWRWTMSLENFSPDHYEWFTMLIGASLMLGWTCLLLWADRKPVERRGVLLLTVFPVISGFLLIIGFAILSGTQLLADVWFFPIKLLCLATLFILAYLEAGKKTAASVSCS